MNLLAALSPASITLFSLVANSSAFSGGGLNESHALLVSDLEGTWVCMHKGPTAAETDTWFFNKDRTFRHICHTIKESDRSVYFRDSQGSFDVVKDRLSVSIMEERSGTAKSAAAANAAPWHTTDTVRTGIVPALIDGRVLYKGVFKASGPVDGLVGDWVQTSSETGGKDHYYRIILSFGADGEFSNRTYSSPSGKFGREPLGMKTADYSIADGILIIDGVRSHYRISGSCLILGDGDGLDGYVRLS